MIFFLFLPLFYAFLAPLVVKSKKTTLQPSTHYKFLTYTFNHVSMQLYNLKSQINIMSVCLYQSYPVHKWLEKEIFEKIYFMMEWNTKFFFRGQTYKGAVMIHVQNTHSTGSTVMCPWRLWPCTKNTKSVVLKGIFCYNRIASPWYFYRCPGRLKCCQAKARDSTNTQNSYYRAVEDATEITIRENNWVNCPNTSTCQYSKGKKYGWKLNVASIVKTS